MISATRERELLEDYAQTRSPAAKLELCEAHLGFVRDRARKMARGCVDPDDLYQAGVIGLLEAIDRFDVASGVRLLSYAQWQIRIRMVQTVRGIVHAVSTSKGGMRPEQRRELKAATYVDADSLALVSGLPSPEEQAAANEARRQIEDAVGALPRRHRVLIEMRWLSNREPRWRDTAGHFGLSEARVRQLQGEAFAAMRKAVGM